MMLEHKQMGIIAIRALKLAKVILLHLKQHTFQQQTIWMYHYL